MNLSDYIIGVCAKPVTYLEIEKAVGAIEQPFGLAIEISRLVATKRLHTRETVFSLCWPLYCVRPIKGGQNPRRDGRPDRMEDMAAS